MISVRALQRKGISGGSSLFFSNRRESNLAEMFLVSFGFFRLELRKVKAYRKVSSILFSNRREPNLAEIFLDSFGFFRLELRKEKARQITPTDSFKAG